MSKYVESEFDMNVIGIDIKKFPLELQDALRGQAVREGKPIGQLFAEIIEGKSDEILSKAGEGDDEKEASNE